MENTFVNIGGHKVSAGIKYSTSEVKTGDVWIDGKPIYRKTIYETITVTPNSQSTLTIDVPHGITNLGSTVKLYGFIGGQYLPWLRPNMARSMTIEAVYSTHIELDYYNFPSANPLLNLTLEYTKTTD